MKKATKITIIILIALIVAVVPLYFYTRPDPTPEDAIQIKGNVASPANFTLSQLKACTPSTIQVTVSSSSRPEENGVFNYTGITLKSLLEQAQVSDNATSIYIQSSDGYGVTLQLSEVIKNERIIIAYEKDGEALTPLKSSGEGPFRLIIGTDQYAQRWIKGVAVVKVT